MKTQGHRSWKYGRIVASIKMPSFTGSWPAFWMLGDNINSVGWPTCGELDIMEQINTDNTVHGSTHWYSGGQADWTSSAGTAVTIFHEYSITWDPNYIKWYIDGNQYSQFYIGGNSGGTTAFNQNNFFIILNEAVGGNWPGFNIDNNAFPATMYVDYVRVYQDGATPALQIPNFVTDLVWRMEAARTFFTRSTPVLTKEMANTMRQKYFYTHEKLHKTLDFNFIPLEQSIREICGFYLKDMEQQKSNSVKL